MKVKLPTNNEVGCALISLIVDKLKSDNEVNRLKEQLVEVKTFNINEIKKLADVSEQYLKRAVQAEEKFINEKNKHLNGEQDRPDVACVLSIPVAKLWYKHVDAIADFIEPAIDNVDNELKIGFGDNKVEVREAFKTLRAISAKLTYHVNMLEGLEDEIPN